MCTIIDKKGREIILKEHNDIIEAYHDDLEIGKIDFLVSNTGDKYYDQIIAEPYTMNIKETFQRAGIATAIIEYAKSKYDVVRFSPDVGTVEDKNNIHYSDEGLQFKNYCEDNNITPSLNYNDYDDY